MEALADDHAVVIREEEPDLWGVGVEPSFGIGQRALLVRTDAGNVLWDCIPLLDEAARARIAELGGTAAGPIGRAAAVGRRRHQFVHLDAMAKRLARPVGVAQGTHAITNVPQGVGPMWGKEVSMHWTNEGFHVQGWLLFPAGYEPQKTYPLIVYVHGGPTYATRPRWPYDGYGPAPLAAMGFTCAQLVRRREGDRIGGADDRDLEHLGHARGCHRERRRRLPVHRHRSRHGSRSSDGRGRSGYSLLPRPLSSPRSSCARLAAAVPLRVDSGARAGAARRRRSEPRRRHRPARGLPHLLRQPRPPGRAGRVQVAAPVVEGVASAGRVARSAPAARGAPAPAADRRAACRRARTAPAAYRRRRPWPQR